MTDCKCEDGHGIGQVVGWCSLCATPYDSTEPLGVDTGDVPGIGGPPELEPDPITVP